MPEFTGIRTSTQSNSSNEDRQVRFVNERVFLFSPQYTPIIMLKGGIMPGPNGERIKVKGLIPSKFIPAKTLEWFDKDNIDIKAFVEGAIADGVDTTINIDDGAGAARNAIRPGSVLRIEDEHVFVISYVTATRLATVIRGIGATTGVAHADDVAVHILSAGLEESSTTQPKVGNLANKRTNLMQIFRHDWEVSRSADKIRLFGGRDKAETMAEAAVEHVREIERQATFGFQAAEAGMVLNGRQVQVTGGFKEFIDDDYGAAASTGKFAGNVHGATVDFNEFSEEFLVPSFEFSSPARRKTFIGGSVMGKVLSRFSRSAGSMQTFVRDTAFGVNVVEVVSPAGTIEFLTSGAIEEVESGYGILFDAQYVSFAFVDNTFMVDNAQAKGTDGFAGFFLTEAGYMFEAKKTITSISGVTGPA